MLGGQRSTSFQYLNTEREGEGWKRISYSGEFQLSFGKCAIQISERSIFIFGGRSCANHYNFDIIENAVIKLGTIGTFHQEYKIQDPILFGNLIISQGEEGMFSYDLGAKVWNTNFANSFKKIENIRINFGKEHVPVTKKKESCCCTII